MDNPNTEELNVEALNQNIAAIHRVRKESDEKRSADQKFADDVASFLGSLKNLYFHLAFYGGLATILSVTEFGPIKSWLDILVLVSAIAAMEALFLTIFVLINQRRMHTMERRNSDLHLQMSLLTEHEITRLIRLTEQIALRVGINVETDDGSLEEIKKDIHPDQIIKKILDHEASIPTDSTKDEI